MEVTQAIASIQKNLKNLQVLYCNLLQMLQSDMYYSLLL